MSYCNSSQLNTQNALLLNHLMEFYNNKDILYKMMKIINGESKISLRIVDWFVTNYAKKYYTVYDLSREPVGFPLNGCAAGGVGVVRFKVHNNYKLKLKAYSKRRFDPFCRWERISIPYDDKNYMETTIGQLNFFKWAIENRISEYIEENYNIIENDMNLRNSTSKKKLSLSSLDKQITVNDGNNHDNNNTKTRKKREELSISACKCIKKETVKITVQFG